MRVGRRVRVEACVTSLAEALEACAVGADRLELCRDLDVGGRTPPTDLVASVVDAVDRPVFVLVRSGESDVDLSATDVRALVRGIEAAREVGAAGVVVGALTRARAIDRPALDGLLAATAPLPLTFHRAFDGVADPLSALEILAEAGVNRVLTSGGAERAWEGRRSLRALVDRAAGRVGILAGGGVRGDHVGRLVDETGVVEVHARAAGIPGVVAALGGRRAP